MTHRSVSPVAVHPAPCPCLAFTIERCHTKHYHDIVCHQGKNNTLLCDPIHNRSRYVDLEIEARNDEPIEDFV